MATLAVQIEALAGTADNALQWANDGISAVIDRVLVLDPESSHLFATNIDDTTSIDISDRRHIISVARGSKIATEIPAEKRFAAAESTSLQKATNDYPQYYYLNQTVQVLPAGSISVSKVDYTTLSNLTGSTIDNFPLSLVPLVVNYAAMKGLNEKMVGYTGLSGLVLSLPSVPPQPTLSFSIADGITAVSNVGDVSLPEYVSIADPSISALDLSSVTVPISPSVPSFTYTDAALQERAEQLVLSLSGTVPVYTKPNFIAPVLTGIESLSLPAAPITPGDPDYSTAYESASLQEAFSEGSILGESVAPTYTPPSFTPIDFSTITSLIETEEDIELAQVKITEEQMKVTEFSSKVQDNLNSFNKENAEYQITYQKAAAEYQSKVGREMEEMRLSTNIDIQNQAKLLEKNISEYNSKIQRYGQSLSQYQQDVNSTVQEFTFNNIQTTFQEWVTEYGNKLQQYQVDAQSQLNEFNSDNTSFQADVQKDVQNFQADAGRRLQLMQQSTNIDVQNKAKSLEKEISEYGSRLQKYTGDLQQYQADVGKAVQEWSLNNLSFKLAKWQADIGENLNEYQAKVASTVQKYSADISRMGAFTQTEANKLAAVLQKKVAENNVELQRFGSALQDFSQRSQVYLSEYTADLQKVQVQYQWYEKQYAMVREQYEKGFEPFMIRRQQDGEQSRIRS
jgi:hypothetical protein